MTYPPQPPGPPGPPGQPGPYGQQPDPYNQGPYGQGQWNQGPQPTTPWTQGPQGFPGPPPPKKRTGLIATLIIVAILVVGGGGVAAYFFLIKDDTRGDGSGGNGDTGPRAAAQTYARELENALNTTAERVDLSKLEPVTCDDDLAKMEDNLTGGAKDAGPGGTGKTRVRLKDFERTDDGATFTLTRRLAGAGELDSRDMTVAKDDGAWKVCGLFSRSGGEDGPGEPSSEAPGGGPVDEDQPSTVEVPPNPIPTS
jgi:hypothetical protein